MSNRKNSDKLKKYATRSKIFIFGRKEGKRDKLRIKMFVRQFVVNVII
jgi:hypothetical protein